MEHSEKFIDNQKRLNLHKNQEEICECRGRIEGPYSAYIPSESILSQKIIFSAHKSTLHGGVAMTMTKVRSQNWIPTLRNLVKFIIRNSNLIQGLIGLTKQFIQIYWKISADLQRT